MNTRQTPGTYVPAQFFDLYPVMSSSSKNLFLGMSALSWGKNGKPELRISIQDLSKFCSLSHVTTAKSRDVLLRHQLICVLDRARRELPTLYSISGSVAVYTCNYHSAIDQRPITNQLEPFRTLLFEAWLDHVDVQLVAKFPCRSPGTVRSCPGAYKGYFTENVFPHIAAGCTHDSLHLVANTSPQLPFELQELIRKSPLPFQP